MMMVIMMMMIVKKITVTVKETSIFAGGLAHRFHRYWLHAGESAVGCLCQRGRTGYVSKITITRLYPPTKTNITGLWEKGTGVLINCMQYPKGFSSSFPFFFFLI